MTPKSGRGKEKSLHLRLHYLGLSVIDYLLNSLDEVVGFFVLTMVIKLTPLKSQPNISQKVAWMGDIWVSRIQHTAQY